METQEPVLQPGPHPTADWWLVSRREIWKFLLQRPSGIWRHLCPQKGGPVTEPEV